MKKVVMLLLLSFGIVIFGLAAVAFAEDTKGSVQVQEGAKAPDKAPEAVVTGSGSLGAFSQYIFRGYEMSRNSIVLQPSVSLSAKGFSLGFWGNIDTNQHLTQSFNPGTAEGQKGYNETDLTLSYTHTFGKFSLTGGYIYYSMKYSDDTEEFFLGGAMDIPTKPQLTIYRDTNSYPGTYINLALGHSFGIYKDVSLDLGASFGYFAGSGSKWKTYERATGDYTGSKYKGFHDGMVKAGLTIPFTQSLSLQPVIQYWFPLSSDAKKTMGYDAAGEKISFNPNGYLGYNVVGGATLVYSF